MIGYGLVLIGSFAFRLQSPDPDSALVLNGLGFTLLATAWCVWSGSASPRLPRRSRQRSRR